MQGWGEVEVNEEVEVWKEANHRKCEILDLLEIPHSEMALVALLSSSSSTATSTTGKKDGLGGGGGGGGAVAAAATSAVVQGEWDKTGAAVPKQKRHKPLKERTHAKPALPKDASGTTILPAVLGNLTVVSLGEVVYDRPKYYSARYIYPVGFETTRSYFSPLVAEMKTLYYNRILDGGEAPLFEVSCNEGGQRLVWSAPTPSGAWAQVIKRVNETGTTVRQSQAVSGPEMYGLANISIQKSVQELPNADKLVGYEFIGDE